jgi:serine/threonine protein kinase
MATDAFSHMWFPDRYTDIVPIGKGAFGRVYRAQNRHRGQAVALKCCRTNAQTGASWRDEKCALQRLHHPNIVKFLDDFEVGLGDEPWTVLELEFVDGRTLKKMSPNPESERPILEIVFQVALALHETHRHGIIHLDVKPTNIMVTDPGEVVKLIDFGIAELGETSLTSDLPGSIGSKKFVTPELADSGACTTACDVWSFGVLLLALLDPEAFKLFIPGNATASMTRISYKPGLLAGLCCRILRQDEDPLARPTMSQIVDELAREMAPSAGKVLLRYQRDSQMSIAWLSSSLTVGDFLKEVEGGDSGRAVVRRSGEILELGTSLGALSGASFEIGEIEEPRRATAAKVKIKFSVEGTSKKDMIRVPEASTVHDFLVAIGFPGGSVKVDDCHLQVDQPIADYLDDDLVVVKRTAPIVEPIVPAVDPIPGPGDPGPRELDLVFAIDATRSMRFVIRAAHDYAGQIVEQLRRNRRLDLRIGSVCYRDPVDNEGDQHQTHPFNNSVVAFQRFLTTVEPIGGGDIPEDYVGALSALLALEWRSTARRVVVWITDAPAHGRRFCGRANHDEEEPKLDPLVRRLVELKTAFRAFATRRRARRTFTEIAKIYEEVDPAVPFRFVQFKQAARDLEAKVREFGEFLSGTVTFDVLDFLLDPAASDGRATPRARDVAPSSAGWDSDVSDARFDPESGHVHFDLESAMSRLNSDSPPVDGHQEPSGSEGDLSLPLPTSMD